MGCEINEEVMKKQECGRDRDGDGKGNRLRERESPPPRQNGGL